MSMKRVLLIILAVFYLSVANGATVYFYYCMGELVHIGMNDQEKSACGTCGMPQKHEKKEPCCKKDSKEIKVDISQKAPQASFQFQPLHVILFSHVKAEQGLIIIPAKLDKAALSNAPPGEQQVPVFIRNCTYRI